MRMRIKFAKTEDMRFSGHLDLHRAWERTFRRAGLPLAYSLIESEPAFGGKIVTDTQDGFVVEGGPDSFITQKPAALRLCRELGLEERLLGTNDAQRKVFVLDGGRCARCPMA